MTKKQSEYIQDICEWLGIDYDREDTIEEASNFISEHVNEMKKVRYEVRHEI